MKHSGTASTGFEALIELLMMLGIGAFLYCAVFLLRAVVFALFDVPRFFKLERA